MAIQQTAELEKIMALAFDKGASDLLLIPNEPVCFRVGGIMERSSGDVLIAEQINEIANAAFGQKLKKIGNEIGELTTSCSVPGVVDGRMCVAKAFGNYTIVIRLMPGNVPDVKTVRVPEAVLEMANATKGLIIFAGLSGSGKTTTMISFLDYINTTRACHICTVEDPMCYHMLPKKAVIQQREVGIDIPNTVSGISTAMRQNTDVLMIGELASIEEIQIGITAAQCGSLVLTQIHAESPIAVIQRLLDVQLEENIVVFRRYLAEVLQAVLVQRLIPRKSGKGRVAAYGYLLVDGEVRKAIASGEDLSKKEFMKSQILERDVEQLRSEEVID